jgi:hypothetical protein
LWWGDVRRVRSFSSSCSFVIMIRLAHVLLRIGPLSPFCENPGVSTLGRTISGDAKAVVQPNQRRTRADSSHRMCRRVGGAGVTNCSRRCIGNSEQQNPLRLVQYYSPKIRHGTSESCTVLPTVSNLAAATIYEYSSFPGLCRFHCCTQQCRSLPPV